MLAPRIFVEVRTLQHIIVVSGSLRFWMQKAALVILLPDYEDLGVRDADSLLNYATLPIECSSCTH